MWPLGSMKKVTIALTFRDRLAFVNADEEQNLLAKWMKKLRAPLVLLDGRSPEATELANGAQQ